MVPGSVTLSMSRMSSKPEGGGGSGLRMWLSGPLWWSECAEARVRCSWMLGCLINKCGTCPINCG
eukprot:1153050-Pelagomonas_calceolata.AAC.6